MQDQPTKTALFVDGPSTYAASRAAGFEIDFRRLLGHVRDTEDLLRAHYYTALPEDGEYSPLRPLVDFLQYNGFAVTTKPQRESVDAQGRRRVRGSVHVEMAVDALDLAPRLEHAIIFSGDADLCPLVLALQRRGVRVTVSSAHRTQPSAIADELRRAADAFVDIEALRGAIERPPRPPVRD